MVAVFGLALNGVSGQMAAASGQQDSQIAYVSAAIQGGAGMACQMNCCPAGRRCQIGPQSAGHCGAGLCPDFGLTLTGPTATERATPQPVFLVIPQAFSPHFRPPRA